MGNPFSMADIEVSPERAAEMVRQGAQLVDVREPYEWEAGHVPGARHVEMERLASQAETIARDRPVVFQCRLGARSALATRAFRAAGYDAWSMAGGIEAWHAEGRPLDPADGYVADH